MRVKWEPGLTIRIKDNSEMTKIDSEPYLARGEVFKIGEVKSRELYCRSVVDGRFRSVKRSQAEVVE
jgi:hypothetical protein